MTSKERYEGLQTKMQACGAEGCLFLSLLSIAEEATEEEIDFITALTSAVKAGCLRESDFYVLDSEKLLHELTGWKWTRRIVPTLDGVEIGIYDYTVCKWYNPRTGYTHFRRRGFDTLTSSTTVKEGYVKEYYIYTWS